MRPAWKGLGGHQRKSVVLGRKFCPACGRWRPVVDFRPRRSGTPHAYCDTCQRRHSNARRHVANLPPEIVERRREANRIYAEAKRREEGVEPRRFKRRPTVVDKLELLFLPPDPLLAHMRQNYADSERELARRAGISERALYRYRSGESELVRLDIADRLALAMGTSLWMLYGDAPLISWSEAHG